jgi:nicotinate-nucleotide adenylyltransferase
VIGILGGTFDPPHNGHVALAQAARANLRIDDLVILVEESPGHRGVVAPADARLAMATAAFPGEDVRLNPHAFTVDTVRDGEFGQDALFILGADQAAMFSRWREPDEVLEHVKLAVGTRGGYDMPDLSAYGDRVVPFELASPEISSSEVRARVENGDAIDDLVPAAVAKLIEEDGLYR